MPARRTPRLLLLLVAATLVLTLNPAAAEPEAPVARVPGASGMGDDYFPLDGNGGIDVLSYDIHNRYRFAQRRLSGWTMLRVRGTAAVSSFSLDFLLPVRRVLVDGRRVPIRQSHHELVVRRALDPGEVVRVRVEYAGRPGRHGYAGERNWLAGRSEVVTMNQPHMAPWWFPANDHPRDKAMVRTSITVPAAYEVIANGQRVRRVVHGRLATTTWRSTEPMAPYLAFFAAGRFRVAEGRRDGRPWVAAVSRGLRPAEQRSAMRLMRRTPRVVAWLERELGVPYPFASSGGLTTSLGVGFALENQTRPTYPYLGEGVGAEQVLVHEVAHQWFGDAVSVDRWRDIWLSEGAATFLEWYWTERHGGRSATAQLRSTHAAIDADDAFWRGVVADPCRPRRDCVSRIFAPYVYERGAMTFQALRNRIGDDAFWRLLRTWVTERSGGTGSTADFAALAERVSGAELDGFFDAWVHTGAKPAATRENGLG